MMDANIDANAIIQNPIGQDLAQKAIEAVKVNINWSDPLQAVATIFAMIFNLFSLGLPVIAVFVVEIWLVKAYVLEKYTSITGIVAWLISLLIVLFFVFPLTAGFLIPLIAGLLAKAGVVG